MDETDALLETSHSQWMQFVTLDNIFVERLWRTIKQEAIHYYRPENITDLELVLHQFVIWCNTQRKHQSFCYKRPAELYYGDNK